MHRSIVTVIVKEGNAFYSHVGKKRCTFSLQLKIFCHFFTLPFLYISK